MGFLPLLVVLAASPGAVEPPRIVIAPLERALERVTLGPPAGLAGPADLQRSPGMLLSIGGQLTIFDRYALTDPKCEARRAEERGRLGGEKVKAWGDLMEVIQQPCRPLEQWWWLHSDAGAEVGFILGQRNEGQLRAWVSPLAWRWFSLGVSSSVVVGEDEERDTAIGMRIGPELAWHLRFDGKESRPVLQIVLRPELSLLRPSHFGHQGVLGARFVYDL